MYILFWSCSVCGETIVSNFFLSSKENNISKAALSLLRPLALSVIRQKCAAVRRLIVKSSNSGAGWGCRSCYLEKVTAMPSDWLGLVNRFRSPPPEITRCVTPCLRRDAAQSNLIKCVCVHRVTRSQPSARTRWSIRQTGALNIRPFCLLSACSQPNLRAWAYFQRALLATGGSIIQPAGEMKWPPGTDDSRLGLFMTECGAVTLKENELTFSAETLSNSNFRPDNLGVRPTVTNKAGNKKKPPPPDKQSSPPTSALQNCVLGSKKKWFFVFWTARSANMQLIAAHIKEIPRPFFNQTRCNLEAEMSIRSMLK